MARRRRKRFPYLGVILLVFSTLWLLRETDVVESHIPWFPVVLIIIAVGLIINRVT